MSESRHYQHAPITEAMINLRVKPMPRVRADTLVSVGD